MRTLLFSAVTLALACSAQAQSARVAPHPQAPYVVPAGPGEAIRLTTFERRPTAGARLDRYRGIRVFRDRSVAVPAGRALPAAPVLYTPDGRFVSRGGATYPVAPR